MNPRALLVPILGLALVAPAAAEGPKKPDIVYEKFGQIVGDGEKLDIDDDRRKETRRNPMKKLGLPAFVAASLCRLPAGARVGFDLGSVGNAAASGREPAFGPRSEDRFPDLDPERSLS